MKTSFKIIALSTLGFTTLCYANESQETNFLTDMFSKSHFDKDFSASIGLRLWENKWNLPHWDYDAQHPRETSTQVLDFISMNNSDNKLTNIPSIGLRYKNFYFGGSYFSKTNYNFREIYVNHGGTRGGYKLGYTPKRSEWDVNGGYYINKNLMLTLGYKTIHRSYNQWALFDNGEKVSEAGFDSKGKGAIIGVTGSAPMGSTGFNLYGNLSYGRLKTNESTDLYKIYRNYNNNYYSGEFGVSYAIPFKDNYFSAISMSLGYRFQRYEFKNVLSPDIAQTAVDTTDGFVAGINILF